VKSTENENRRRHSKETKVKIAKSNSGKVFSEERRRNISKAREVMATPEQLVLLKECWDKHFVTSTEIMARFDLSERVYRRFVKLYCTEHQIKHLDQTVSSDVYQAIIDFCKEGVPYKDIADQLFFGHKWMRHTIVKLGECYDIKPIPKPKPPKTEAHKAKLAATLAAYNKENPKKKEENPNWKGGITSVIESIRKSERYKAWRLEVMKRDGFRCIACGANRNLQVDHIYPLVFVLQDANITSSEQAENCMALWNSTNGRTLCVECHRKTETYGKQRKKQIKEIEQ
jgi:hypothetical protein